MSPRLAILRFACLCALALGHVSLARAQVRSFDALTTGNGHGFAVFDRPSGTIQTLLEHPYRYVAPLNAARNGGVGRRDLAHDLYFGVRSGDQRVWLERTHAQTQLEYEAESHIIHGTSQLNGLAIDTYYFSPFGYEGNALIALIRVRNDGAASAQASVFFKPNLKLGSAGATREDPLDDDESISFLASATPPHAVETGAGGGHALYVPIDGFDQASCGADATLYDKLATADAIGTASSCSGAAQVMVFGRELTIAAHDERWWGEAVLFVDDDPKVIQAADFRDQRTPDAVLTSFATYLANRTAKALHDAALTEAESFHSSAIPKGLSDKERKLFRQSESVLRMAQVREARQENRENYGMLLATLPPGEWHTGWVRDASYSIASLSMTGHFEQARLGLEFLLGADGKTHGFFNQGYLAQTYRVSATRYYGNGKEEGDFNADGPNVETDGWGLVLWAAGTYLHESCDRAWLDEKTWRGDSVYEALSEVADDITSSVVDGLPAADASIWEVHWGKRQVFTFTAAAQARGLFDFANIAQDRGDTQRAEQARNIAKTMQARMLTDLVHSSAHSLVSHRGVAASDVFVDGSVVEALMLELVAQDDPVYAGTLAAFSRLQTPFGGYQRLEPKLSLTGGSGADLYDASEWIMLDLRIGQAARRMGDTSSADTRLDWVTNSAALNDNLIPELFDRNNGGYAGAVPIVGYGAGAWLMTALEKHGAVPPGPQRALSHCDGVEPDAGAAEPDAGHPVQPGMDDAGTTPVVDGGTSQVPEGDAGGPGKADVKHSSACAAHPHAGSAGVVPVWWALLLAAIVLARRKNWRESR